MDVTKELINKFYTAFANNDCEKMIDCYHDDIQFEDPAFGVLKGDRAKSMWKMLVSRLDENASIHFSDIETNGPEGSANWIAKYNYGPKNRPVINFIHAQFIIEDGKIIDHRDYFDSWKWSRQALGLPGLLLGWSGFMNRKIQQTTNEMLDQYIAKNEV